MAGICFYYEDVDVDVWSGKDLDAWNYACKVAGDITKMIVVNGTDQIVVSPDSELDFEVVEELPELGKAAYIVCPWESPSLSLWDFEHDVDWYVFGPASGWNAPLEESRVSIPQSGRGAVHSAHIATVVMFHRYWTLK